MNFWNKTISFEFSKVLNLKMFTRTTKIILIYIISNIFKKWTKYRFLMNCFLILKILFFWIESKQVNKHSVNIYKTKKKLKSIFGNYFQNLSVVWETFERKTIKDYQQICSQMWFKIKHHLMCDSKVRSTESLIFGTIDRKEIRLIIQKIK